MRLISNSPTAKQRSGRRVLVSRGLLAMSLIMIFSGIAAWCQTTASVSVNAGSTMAVVGPEAYGVDTSVYDGDLTASGVAAEVQSAGIDVLRYPGGSYADIFNFISGTDQTLNEGGYLAPNATFNYWMPDLVLPAGVKAMITVNYGSNPTATGGGQPSEAASWVQYANVTNNYNIMYWEIGNEIYGNGYYSTGLDWEYDLHDTDQTAADRVGNSALSPTAYGTNAAAFIKAMKAVDPNIKCGVFASDAGTYPNWDQDVFTAISSGLNGSGYTLDFVIEHYYPSGSDAQYLAAQTVIPSQVAQLRSDIANYYTVGNGSSIQIAITESGTGSPGGIFPFLWSVDDYLTWIENGAFNVEYQELHSGFLTSASPGVPEGPWYGASLSSTIARPGDTMVTASSSNSLLRAHAVRRADGQTGVILLNDDPSNSTAVTVNISGATLASTGTQYNFGNANFSSGASTANSGISSSSISGVGSSFKVTVPAYSAMGILIPAGSSSSFTLSRSAPTLSVAQGSTATDTITVTDVGGFTGSVTLAASGLPTGVTAAFGTNPTTGSSVVTFTASSTATTGTSTVTITGTSGSLTATTTISLTVTSSVCTPTAIMPYIYTASGGWVQESSISVASGTAVNLGPQPTSGGSWAWTGPNGFTSTSREIDNIALGAGANVYTATYTNSCGDKSTQAFTITAPGSTGSFTLKPSASTLSIAQSSSGTDTITVTDVSPFSGSVAFTASGMPSGVTAAFSPTSSTTSSVLTLTASSTATTGASTVTVTGTSGSLSATTTITLAVTAASCTPTAIVPYISVAGVWSAAGVSSATVASTSTAVDLGPQPSSGGSWAWTGPNGFTSTSREIDNIALSAGANVYTATYTNSCGAKSTQAFTITVTSSTGSFSLKPSSSSLSVTQGASGTDTITVTDVSPFSGSVTLAASGLPSGVTAAFATNPATSTSVLTLTASSSAATGSSTVTITGTSGSLSATTTIALTVSAASAGSFSLKPSASTLTVKQGASGTDTITVTDVSPFSGSVTLAASGLPSGVTAAFATNPATSTSVLTLTASSSAATGSSTVTITGTSGSLSATTTIALTVSTSGGGSACTVDYTISPQTSSAFGAAVTIVNNGTTALSNWTLTWSFANGQTIASSWNGTASQSGANVTVSEQSGQTWENIPAGGSYSGFGFNGTWNGTTNAIPTAFSLNGTACTVN
jgi:hypothetical protein